MFTSSLTKIESICYCIVTGLAANLVVGLFKKIIIMHPHDQERR